MAELTTSDLLMFGREVAAAISEGFSPEQILMKFDLSPLELEEIFQSKEFSDTLAKYGEEVIRAFGEMRSATASTSVHAQLSDKLKSYYAELDRLAMTANLDPKKRADILLALAHAAAPEGVVPKEIVQMPPALIDNWAKRHHIYESACRAHRRHVAEEPAEAGRAGDHSAEVPRPNRGRASTPGS